MNAKCENCRFWERLKPGVGRCHRYPPTTHALQMPQTDPGEWCGEHQRIKNSKLKR